MQQINNAFVPDPVYAESFSRNLGILTEAEQTRLSQSTVLVVGTGGIGSNCVAILARMGVGRFHLVDPDTFELANINRQYGAKVSTQGRYKVDVLQEEVLDINPSAEVRTWKCLFAPDLADTVFAGADLCIDAIDFYAIDDHLDLHRAARNNGLFVLMGSPVGFSGCLQVFDPEGMSLESFCGMTPGMNEVEKQLRYACGIVPKLAHISYYDVSRKDSNTDFLKGSGPSLATACTMASAFVASEAVLLLLGRRKPRAIPHTLQHDPCTFRTEAAYIDGGMTAYDPGEVIAGIADKSSLVVNVFDHFYRKVRAATLDLPDGGRLCYRIEGTGSPLVLIAPAGCDTSFWARQTPALAEHFKVITIDNRGTGRSSVLPEGADTVLMAQDVIALLAHLGIEPAVLAGCAMGALTALQVALLTPQHVAGLSLCSAYLAADSTILETTGAWRQVAQARGMAAVFDESLDWLFSPGYRAENADELYKLKTFYRVNEQHPDCFCRQTLAGNSFVPVAPLGQLRTPVDLVHGGKDRLVKPDLGRALAAALPDATMTILPDAGHFPTWEAAPDYNRRLLEFAANVLVRLKSDA